MMLKNYVNYYINWLSKPKDCSETEDFTRIRNKIKEGIYTTDLGLKWRLAKCVVLICPGLMYFASKPYRLIKRK